MKTSKSFLLILVSALCISSIQGQNADITEMLNDQGLVILSESNQIDIADDKLEFMIFYISKEVRYKIVSDNGIERISKIILPEKLDPTYIFHAPKERNFSHVYSRMNCEYFTGSVSSADGSTREFNLEPEIEEIEMMMKDLEYYGTYKKFIYRLENLKIGDIVTIKYKYSVPYQENFYQLNSFRIFFNSDIPKNKYELTINHHPELYFQTDYLNNAEPDTIIKTEKMISYHWKRDTLYGCIDEPGSRPYLSLPHVTFSPMPYDLYYTVEKSFERRFTPFYVLYAMSREERHRAISLSVLQGVNTPQYLQIRKFVKRQAQGIMDDTTGIKTMQKIHQTITDNFEYGDNMDFFTREDIRDPKIGDQIGNQTLTDLSRNDLYLAMMLELDLNYCTTYLTDNRSGVISDNFFLSMYDSDFLYTAFYGEGEVAFFYPKRARYGYYMNELPFYFENTRARLVQFTDYLKREGMINEEFRQVYTPISPVSNNIRNTRVAVNINLDEMKTEFNTQVYLSGQFSTMTRGLYEYDYQLEKVNHLYNKKVWDIGSEVQLNDHEITIETKEPPFTSRLKANYTSDKLIKKDGDSYILSIKNWFNHIIAPDLTARNRQMPYYPDFSNRDSYIYFIKFDKEIDLTTSLEPIVITTDHINLNIQIDQLDKNSIKIESFLALTGIIGLDEMQELEKAFNEIEKLNNSSLIFREIGK